MPDFGSASPSDPSFGSGSYERQQTLVAAAGSGSYDGQHTVVAATASGSYETQPAFGPPSGSGPYDRQQTFVPPAGSGSYEGQHTFVPAGNGPYTGQHTFAPTPVGSPYEGQHPFGPAGGGGSNDSTQVFTQVPGSFDPQRTFVPTQGGFDPHQNYAADPYARGAGGVPFDPQRTFVPASGAGAYEGPQAYVQQHAFQPGSGAGSYEAQHPFVPTQVEESPDRSHAFTLPYGLSANEGQDPFAHNSAPPSSEETPSDSGPHLTSTTTQTSFASASDLFASDLFASESESDLPLDPELDAAFDLVQIDNPEDARPGQLAYDVETERDVHDLFGKMVISHSAQIRQFALELSVGETTSEWAEICRGAISSICAAAAQIGHSQLLFALRAFEIGVDLARGSGKPRIEGELRTQLLNAYQELRRILPDAFNVDDERNRREPIIIHNLLRQVQGVRRLELDKMYAAGLTTLEMLYRIREADLCEATGLDRALCGRVVKQVESYRAERLQAVPDDESGRERLRTLVVTLRETEDQFRAAPEQTVVRRELRQNRDHLVRQLYVHLAQSGEVDLVDELARYSVQRKIECIEAFLKRAK